MDFKLYIGIFILITFTSCVGSQTLYNGLTRERSTLEYLHDSPISLAQKLDTIQIIRPVVTDPIFSWPGHLEKIKETTMPFFIYNGWEFEYEYTIGANIIEEGIPEFVKSALINEFDRSSSIYTDSASTSSVQLEVEIDSIGAKGPYKGDGYFVFMFFAYASSSNEYAGPGVAFTRLNYTLRSNESELLKGTVQEELITESLKNVHYNKGELRSYFSTQLTEALSMTLKANIEDIVYEIDKYFRSSVNNSK